ncbi:MAG TPA: HAMP domain-containing sensor histidine kinase [Aquabacterium sp.]|nr:HAMP domain-containing sensor histidine kinase [Aquabacterium sp.]
MTGLDRGPLRHRIPILTGVLSLTSVGILACLVAAARLEPARGLSTLAGISQFIPLLYVGAHVALPERARWLCWGHYALTAALYLGLYGLASAEAGDMRARLWFTMLLAHPCYILALQAMLALRQRLRATEREVEARKTRFVAMLSHDIRTPLQAMLGSIDLLDLKVADGSVEQRAVARLRAATTQLETHLRDVADYARFGDPHWPLNLAPLSVRPWLEEIGLVHQAAAQARGLSLEVDVSALPADLAIQTDAARLRQILDNLLSNAMKYTEQGHVRVTASLPARPAEHLCITVCDSGAGIAPADQARIFEPFVRLEGPTARRVEGSGLGLAIVQRLVRRLHGQLSLDSTPGHGSCFRVCLPRVTRQ